MRPRLLLASASPRRAELLARLGVEVDVQPVDIDETPRDEAPEAYVARVAAAKADAAWQRLSSRPNDARALLAADTAVVSPTGGILGKPKDPDDARQMLRALEGAAHTVLTAYVLVDLATGRRLASTVSTTVRFRKLAAGEVEAYVTSGEWRGKAGGYAVQGLAAAFVRTVEGSYTNVVGLPLCEVAEDLAVLGLCSPPAYPREDGLDR
jgi:septum formation protein